MRASGTALLGALALALAGVLAIELAAPGPVARSPPQPPGLRTVAAAVAATGRVDRWVRTILARPLFSPNRRPAATAAAAGPVGLPRLAGVVVGPEGRTVIFAAAAGGAPILAHEGGQVGAWRVQSIGAGEVTVHGPDGVRVLRPAFADATPDAAAAHPAPAKLALSAAPTASGKVPSVFSMHLPFAPLPRPKTSR